MVRAEEHNIVTYYKDIFNRSVEALDEFRPEDIVPAPYTLLVRMIPPDETTKGGLLLPDVARKEKGLGVVMAVPETKEFCPWGVGDVVLFAKHAGQPIEFEGCDDFILVQWGDDGPHGEIMAKVKGGGIDRLKKWLDGSKESS